MWRKDCAYTVFFLNRYPFLCSFFSLIYYVRKTFTYNSGYVPDRENQCGFCSTELKAGCSPLLNYPGWLWIIHGVCQECMDIRQLCNWTAVLQKEQDLSPEHEKALRCLIAEGPGGICVYLLYDYFTISCSSTSKISKVFGAMVSVPFSP